MIKHRHTYAEVKLVSSNLVLITANAFLSISRIRQLVIPQHTRHYFIPLFCFLCLNSLPFPVSLSPSYSLIFSPLNVSLQGTSFPEKSLWRPPPSSAPSPTQKWVDLSRACIHLHVSFSQQAINCNVRDSVFPIFQSPAVLC